MFDQERGREPAQLTVQMPESPARELTRLSFLGVKAPSSVLLRLDCQCPTPPFKIGAKIMKTETQQPPQTTTKTVSPDAAPPLIQKLVAPKSDEGGSTNPKTHSLSPPPSS